MHGRERLVMEPQIESESGTRDKIIAAALDEFAEHGRAGARVDRIAAAAGVNKAMIYYHFKSKDLLYVESLKEFFANVGRYALKLVGETNTLDEALLALATVHATIITVKPQVRTLFLRELADLSPEIINTIIDSFRQSGLVDVIKEKMHGALASGRIRQIDPRQLISAFISMSIGYYFLYPISDALMQVTDREQFIEERKHIIVDIFLNGIKVK